MYRINTRPISNCMCTKNISTYAYSYTYTCRRVCICRSPEPLARVRNVCMYVCAYVYVYIYMRIQIYAYMCIYVHIDMYRSHCMVFAEVQSLWATAATSPSNSSAWAKASLCRTWKKASPTCVGMPNSLQAHQSVLETTAGWTELFLGTKSCTHSTHEIPIPGTRTIMTFTEYVLIGYLPKKPLHTYIT